MAERVRDIFPRSKERRTPANYLYSASELAQTRARLEGQKVVFVDANGVLCTIASPWERNPQANLTIKLLEQAGYYLVLWTRADRIMLSIIEDLGVDLDPFSLKITGQDFARETPQRQQLFEQAVRDCPWLEAEVKTNLIHDHPRLKTPVLLTDQPFVFIQDFAQYSCFKQGIPARQCINLYPYGGAPVDNFKNLAVFGPEIASRIRERSIFD